MHRRRRSADRARRRTRPCRPAARRCARRTRSRSRPDADCRCTAMLVSLQIALEIAEHDARGLRIEARHRLVGQDHGRLLRQRAGDADALLLAAGELIGARACALCVKLDALAGIPSRSRRRASETTAARRAPTTAGHAADQHVLQHRSAASPDCGAGRSSRPAAELAAARARHRTSLPSIDDRARRRDARGR